MKEKSQPNKTDALDLRAEVNERVDKYRGPSQKTQSVLAYLIVSAFVLCISSTTAVALWSFGQGHPVQEAVALLNAVGAVFGSLTGAVVVFYFRNVGEKSE